MAKYYVESGDLRMIVEHRSPVRAAGLALSLAEGLNLGPAVTINEQGFIDLRADRQPRPCDLVLETGHLLALIAEHALA